LLEIREPSELSERLQSRSVWAIEIFGSAGSRKIALKTELETGLKI